MGESTSFQMVSTRISSSSLPKLILMQDLSAYLPFIIDKETPGLLVGIDQPMIGIRGTSHVELFFYDVKLGPEALLGMEGEGFKLALETLGRVRLAQIGARAV